MKKIASTALAACALCAAALCSCSGPAAYTVEGEVTGAEPGQKVAVEQFNGLHWLALDSVKIGKNAQFKYQGADSVSTFEILRLGYNGQSIYFPVTQGANISISANAADFAGAYELGGTPSAQAMMLADKLINASLASQGVTATLADDDLKRQLLNDYMLNDSIGAVSYYLIRKTCGGKNLFSLANRRDVMAMGAVATKLTQLYPNDSRALQLAADYMAARQALGMGVSQQEINLQAEETGLIDIALPDRNGKTVKLSEVAASAPATILSFTTYGLDNSAAYNIKLNQVVEANPGVAVYQVAYDDDEVFWFQSSSNLPWTTVRGASQAGQTAYMSYFPYNPAVMPLTFVINGHAEISARVDNLDDLDTEVKKAIK